MPGPILCASLKCEDPFSRSYRVNLPSSLTVNLPSALVYSTRPRVSVYGTGAATVKLSGFSRKHDYLHSRSPKALRTFRVQLRGWICLPPSTPTSLNALFRQRAGVSLLRLHIARCGSNGILTVSAIGLAIRLILRTRLTPGRLALPGKPWSFGGRASHPPYRYLYLHLLFPTLQRTSPCAFKAEGNAPLPIHNKYASRVIPDYYPCTVPRLVSCYALFE